MVTGRGVRSLYGIREPCVYHCWTCDRSDLTIIKRKSTTKQICIAGGCCLICCLPVVLTPFLINDCYIVKHYCQHCGVFLGESTETDWNEPNGESTVI